jgi:hypothetical protein
MAKEITGEKWKKVKFDFEYANKFTLEVSDLGRVRTFNTLSDGNILKGSMIKGYKIIRLKMYTGRDEKIQKKLDADKRRVFKLAREIKQQIADKAPKTAIKEATLFYEKFKADLSLRYQNDLKSRTINYHSLVHRLVADAFLKAPKKAEVFVGHIDHKKLNNTADNLKWMTKEENYAHQLKNPALIKSIKAKRAAKAALAGK